MMKIDRHNYEEYLLEYLEGELKGEILEAMEAFLAIHPEILPEVEGLSHIRLQAPTIHYPLQHNLKRNIEIPAGFRNHDEWFAAYAGMELSAVEMERLEDFLDTYPEYRKDFKAYQLTILSPDLQIKYPDKAGLKHSVPLFGMMNLGRTLQYTTAVAAAISLLIISIWVGRIVLLPEGQLHPTDMAYVLQDYPETIASPRIPSGIITKIPETTKEITQPTAIHNIRPSTKQSLRSQAENPSDQAREERNFPTLHLSPRNAQLDLLAGNAKKPEPGIILPRYQSGSPNPLYLAGDYPMAQADARGVLPSLIGRWLGIPSQEENNPRTINTTELLWTVADRSLGVLNAMTDNDIQLLRATDDAGNTTAYAFVTERFEIARKAQREE